MGEHGGSFMKVFHAMTLRGRGQNTQMRDSGAVPIDRTLCPIDRTGFLPQLTETVHCLIDRANCRIDQTENMPQLSAFWHCPIDRTALSDRSNSKILIALQNFKHL